MIAAMINNRGEKRNSVIRLIDFKPSELERKISAQEWIVSNWGDVDPLVWEGMLHNRPDIKEQFKAILEGRMIFKVRDYAHIGMKMGDAEIIS